MKISTDTNPFAQFEQTPDNRCDANADATQPTPTTQDFLMDNVWTQLRNQVSPTFQHQEQMRIDRKFIFVDAVAETVS